MTYKVTTAVTVEPVTLAEARLQCKLTADDSTSEDTLITAWITAMREVAEHYTGRAVAPQTLTMGLVEFLKYTDTAGMEQTISASAYSLSTYGDSRRVAPTYGNYWPTTQDIPDAVRILYVTGYGAPSAGAGFAACPKAAKQAILLMVAWLHANRGDSIQPDDIQPPAAKSLLNTIKAWGF
jgi:hypothetical protein